MKVAEAIEAWESMGDNTLIWEALIAEFHDNIQVIDLYRDLLTYASSQIGTQLGELSSEWYTVVPDHIANRAMDMVLHWGDEGCPNQMTCLRTDIRQGLLYDQQNDTNAVASLVYALFDLCSCLHRGTLSMSALSDEGVTRIV